MPLRRASVLLFCAAALLPLSASAARKAAPAHSSESGTYKSVVVMDAATGKILHAENAELVSPPASMTKLMTFAVLSDKLASGALTLETPVAIDITDAKMGGTQVFLDPRETFSVEELIYAMMIQSANDAAHALARTAGGSVESFVGLMNAKAAEIGMTHTTFRSPHGLPPPSRRIAEGDLTTAEDFALLCRYLLQKTDVLKYTSVRTRDFGAQRPKGPQHMKNHNNLLGKVTGVDGLKTGYTEGAGYCLSATAERNRHRVIVVIMGAFGPKGQKDLGRFRDQKAIEFLEKGFATIPADSPPFASAVPVTPASSAPKADASPFSSAPASPDDKAAAPADGEPSLKFSVPPLPKKKG